MFTRGMEFDLGEDVGALREMVHRWAQDRLGPIAGRVDRENVFPAELWREMGELGFGGMLVPEAYGGQGMPHVVSTAFQLEIGDISGSIHICMPYATVILSTAFNSLDRSLDRSVPDRDATQGPGQAMWW